MGCSAPPSPRPTPSRRPGARRAPGSAPAVADQHAARLDDVEVAALERRRRDHAPDRDARLLVEADHRRVLAAPPPLVHLRDDGAVRRHEARVAREHLVRQAGSGSRKWTFTPASGRRRPSRRAGAWRGRGRTSGPPPAWPWRSSSSAASGSGPGGRAGRRAACRTRSPRPRAPVVGRAVGVVTGVAASAGHGWLPAGSTAAAVVVAAVAVSPTAWTVWWVERTRTASPRPVRSA